MKEFILQLLPILILLGVIGVVVKRLPKVEITHSLAFVRRRRLNWVVLGLAYAFLYFGRYNLTVAKVQLDAEGLMSNSDFGMIFGIGAITYGCSFLINGPLCDKLGGRTTMLIALAGSSFANLLMGLFLVFGRDSGINLTTAFTVLYAVNMYFQSFGAVSIIKVNAFWFHVRERGVIGGMFGILISLGVYFAYDWNPIILKNLGVNYVFLIPSAVLFVMFVVSFFVIRDNPSKAGLEDFNTGDATSDDTGPQLKAIQVFKKLLSNPIILTVAAIEFCSGYMRNAIMQWGPTVQKMLAVHKDDFVFSNWGMVLCVVGIFAGIFAGIISDYVFKSRRGPVAAILYMGMLAGTIAIFFVLDNVFLGISLAFIMLCVFGVHGMLSGTATMDFGGSKNAGIATGIIDAFVYLGTGLQAFILGAVLPDMTRDGIEVVSDPANWWAWPMAMLPVVVVGLFLCIRIWNASVKPGAQKGGGKGGAPSPGSGSEAASDSGESAEAAEATA
ncbi:MAG: MFS transporter [Proteobacteria bacterium]|nr:MFS transporter [Pseudomonadota bacterium]